MSERIKPLLLLAATLFRIALWVLAMYSLSRHETERAVWALLGGAWMLPFELRNLRSEPAGN